MTPADDTSTVVANRHGDPLERHRSKHASLVMIHGPQMGVSFPLTQSRLTIGRASSCDIQIEDENISRKHAELLTKESICTVRDLDSTNGTYVNSRRVVEVELKDGDLLMISTSVFKYVSSGSIENRFFDQMYSMVTTDHLTRLHNRRYFMARIDEEFNRSRRHDRALSVIIFDFDNFKRINDVFGHAAGDQLLRKGAQLVLSHVRSNDTFARFGGDEFCVLCPETTGPQAMHLADRLRGLFEETKFTFQHNKLRVSISVGVAELTPDMGTPTDLVNVADKALYAAKEAGRNQIRLAEQVPAGEARSSRPR
jgi:diguanylate cyclase (GGDEF)-like protein